MEQTIAIPIPRQWLKDVPEKKVTWQQIFKLGLDQYKMRRALVLYRDGAGSLGYIAEQLGLSKRKLIQEARLRGIEPDFSAEMVREELG
jgi:predicted HTH domain antitoxin